MQDADKSTVIYSALFGLIALGGLVLLLSMTDCRQESAVTACAVRWGNYGLSIQMGDQLHVWLLGTSDVRLWPSRWQWPLAVKWSVGIMVFSLVGMLITLFIAWLDHLYRLLSRKAT